MSHQKFLKLWIDSFKNRRKYLGLVGKMINHLNKSPIENNLKGLKMRKLHKLYKDINSILNIPLQIHQYAYAWISLMWKKRVIENGFIDINNTLKYLDLDNIPVRKWFHIAISLNHKYLDIYFKRRC